MIASPFAIRTRGSSGIVMRNRIAQGEGAQMRDLTKEIDRRLGIAIFQFPIRGTHAAQRLNLAVIANRGTRARLGANFVESTVPSRAEAALANVVALLMGDYADAHSAAGIHGAIVDASAAGITMIFWLRLLGRCCKIAFGEAAIFFFAGGVAKLERHYLFRRKANR